MSRGALGWRVGFGEGRRLVGVALVTTDGGGHADFSEHVSGVSPGQELTATATNTASGDTSEFSACVTVS